MATSAGRSGMFSVAATVSVLVVALVAPRTPPVAIAAAGITAVGLVARTIRGHMSASALGGIAIAVHVLAAAVWCGTLAALVLTVEHRGQWARVLPRFSELSLLCVIALLIGGVTGALVAVNSVSQLLATGYGSLTELAIMAVALTIAAALSVTG